MANIYIVEDDTNIQEIEAIALKNSGHSVEQFDDAAHFYKKLEEKLPDLAILDLMLPILRYHRQAVVCPLFPCIRIGIRLCQLNQMPYAP